MDNNYSNKRILVTGASGFIGSRLIAKLSKLGAEIHALSRQESLQDNTIQWHKADLTNYTDIENIFHKTEPHYVFHLASEVTGRRDLDAVIPTLNNNLISSVHILTAATKIPCEKIVLAGSLEEPDYNDATPIPTSPYAAAKWSSSGYAKMFKQLYNTPVVTTRIFMVYGPGQIDLNKLVPYVILSLLKNQSPKLSSGTRPVDWIFVDDVVDALIHTGALQVTDNIQYDIGSGTLLTTRELVEKIFNIMNSTLSPDFGTLPDRAMEQVRVANSNLEYKLLDWSPNHSIDEGLKATIEWYQHRFESGLIS